MKKHFLIFALLFIGICASCQHCGKLKVRSFEAENDVYIQKEIDTYHWDTLRTSLWAYHRFDRFSGDTGVYAILSSDEDTLFIGIYNKEYRYRKIILDNIPKGIHSIFYHNDDSIFVFYDRFIVMDMKENRADFILLDGSGKPQHYYSLDSMPYVRKTYNKHHTLALHGCCNQIVDSNLILLFTPCKPYVSQTGYDTFNPPIAAAYNLKSGNIRMLNIRFPESLTERKFGKGISPKLWMKHIRDNDFILGFETSPYIYHYNLTKDSMYMNESYYDKSFLNTDSSSMKKGKDYVSTAFYEPYWLNSESCYTRWLSIYHRSGYNIKGGILELMDSNFNHLSYLVADNCYRTPYISHKHLITYTKTSYRPHKVFLKDHYRWISREKLLDRVTEKRLPRSCDTLDFRDYLKQMQIPRASLLLIINLEYPCGECLDFLFSNMKENQKSYAENRIYYIVYDDESSGLLKELLKRHGLTGAPNIMEDNGLLGNVYLGGQPMSEGQFFLVDYGSLDKEHIAIQPHDFASLKTIFKLAVKQQIEKK